MTRRRVANIVTTAHLGGETVRFTRMLWGSQSITDLPHTARMSPGRDRVQWNDPGHPPGRTKWAYVQSYVPMMRDLYRAAIENDEAAYYQLMRDLGLPNVAAFLFLQMSTAGLALRVALPKDEPPDLDMLVSQIGSMDNFLTERLDEAVLREFVARTVGQSPIGRVPEEEYITRWAPMVLLVGAYGFTNRPATFPDWQSEYDDAVDLTRRHFRRLIFRAYLGVRRL